LKDGTQLTLGENATLVVDEFIYDPYRSRGELAIRVVKGAFLYAGGLIDKETGANVRIRTPLAAIGIRGTARRQRSSGGGPKAPSGGSRASVAKRRILEILYQCLVRLAGWRATEEFRMSDPDRLTSRADTASALDKQGLVLRIVAVAFLAALFWHTVVAAAPP
jgi:FecR protein